VATQQPSGTSAGAGNGRIIRKLLLGMLVFVPIALFLRLTGGSDGLIFLASALAIVPLADFIGEATEELVVYTGPKFGGLLNATLGNAAELIITVMALSAGLLDLVKASIVGSIIGNLLLVMGLSMFLGGLKYGTQKFDRSTASLNATLLLLAVAALTIPSIFSQGIEQVLEDAAAGTELLFSEGIALVMIVIYALSLIYMFRSKDETISHEPGHTHPSRWSLPFTLVVLAASTVGVALMSEFLVGSVEHVTETMGLSEFFIGIIIIPLVGNIAEHIVAVEVAMKNRMELSMAITLNSSLQIALFVAPVLVFISLLFQDKLLLIFNQYELVALIATSFIAAFIANDGESNWLEGAMLLAVYLLLVLAFFFLPTLPSVH
jgi:Ca2+:H+ antiporter